MTIHWKFPKNTSSTRSHQSIFSKILFLPSLMHKNKYSYYYLILSSLTPWNLGVLSLGSMMQIYLKPLTSTTQSVSQMLSRLGLDLKPGLIFHGHCRSNKILRFLWSGPSPKNCSKTKLQGRMDKYNLPSILTLTHFIIGR